MKPVKTIKDPESFQLLADQTRRKIIFLLRVKEMTVSQIASELSLTPQAVYHHIKKLQKGGLVEVVREERLGHLIESYYMTTAESFNFKLGKPESKSARSQKAATEFMRAALEAMRRLGFDLKYTEPQLAQLLDLASKIHDYTGVEKYEEAIAEMDDLDYTTKLELHDFVWILSASDKEFSQQLDYERRCRELLKSFLVKK
jgi:DNA-binding transcriptional ArsR family regulator